MIAKKLGLDLNIPTVLIMGGGQGLGPMKEAVKSLVRLEAAFAVDRYMRDQCQVGQLDQKNPAQDNQKNYFL